jgi:RNA polymerase sigma-70 factor (ECF subfamily)
MNRTELELVRRARRGEAEAFTELVRRHQGMVRGLVRLLGGRSDPDDLVQDVFLEAWRSLPRLREPLRFLSWLQGVARNVCRQARRRERAGPVREEVDVEAVSVEEREPGRIDELLAGLPGNVARVMREKFCHGRSYREIAHVTGMKRTQVRHLMEKGLRSIAARLASERRSEAIR